MIDGDNRALDKGPVYRGIALDQSCPCHAAARLRKIHRCQSVSRTMQARRWYMSVDDRRAKIADVEGPQGVGTSG